MSKARNPESQMLFYFMEEIWKPIPGYEGLYELSNIGRLKSLPKIIHDFGIHKKVITKEKIRKYPRPTKNGYRSYALTKDKIRHTGYVHKLLALCFLENDDPQNKTQVNHIDGDKTNDVLSNLEWCTPGENQKHAWDTNLRKRFLQKDHPKSKQVINTITGEIYDSIKALSILINVKHSTLRSQLNGSYKNNTIYKIL